MILELSRAGHYLEVKKVITEKRSIVIENMYPDKNDDKKLKAARSELYGVFSKYVKKADEK